MTKQRKQLTIVLVHQPPRLLLGLGKRSSNQGLWNGFGGKVEEDEAVEEAAQRELWEEAGICAEALEERGVIEFESTEHELMFEVHIYHASHFTGEPTETDEMRPQWFDEDSLPLDQMWPADLIWLPLFLEGRHFAGRVLYGPNKAILSHTIAATD